MKNKLTGKIVKIYAMIHIAPQEFYDSRYSMIYDDYMKDYAIHHEGIKNISKSKANSNKPKNKAYNNIAKIIHFDNQKIPDYCINNVGKAKVSDVDFSDFKKITQLFIKCIPIMLKIVSILIEKTNKQLELQEALVSISETEREVLLPRLISKDILDKRNHYAIQEALKEDGNVSLVWGKAHLSGMIKILESHGYLEITD